METLHPDSPIAGRAEDLLNYRPFATALARGLVERAPKDGLVVGIEARWGMGKSSAINLMLEAVREIEEARPASGRTRIGTFNPWLFSGLEALARGYLSQLGRLIEEALDQGTPERTRAFVRSMIKGGGELAGGAAALAVAGAVPGGVGLWGAVRSSVAGLFGYFAQRLADKSLEAEIEDLRSQLERLSVKFVMVVDDLDRLRPDELLQILTLIKTFGNLPNVIHLLAYDRRILDASLAPAAAATHERIPTYLEKIVQVEIALPPPGKTRLRRLALDRLSAILGPEHVMDEEDWTAVVEFALEHYVRSPRDVMRLLNALSVVWPAVSSEVYLPDLFAVEVLRLFEPDVYDRLRDAGAFLTGRAIIWSKEDKASHANRITDAVHETRRKAVMELLARLFPAAHEAFAPQGFVDNPDTPEGAGRRVGSWEGFEAYFGFASDPDEIPAATLREVAGQLDDEAALRAAVADAMGRRRSDGISFVAPLLGALLQMVRGRERLNDALLRTLLALGDGIMDLVDYEGGFVVTTNVQRLRRLLVEAARRIPRDVRAARIEAAVLNADAGLHASSFLVAILGSDHGIVFRKNDQNGDEPILRREEVEALASALASRIAEQQEGIRPTPQTDLILGVWGHVVGSATPRAWIATRLADPAMAAALAFSTMADVTSSARPYRYRTLRETPNEAYDLDAMASALEGHLEAGNVAAEHEGDVRRFVHEARLVLARVRGEKVGDVDDDG